MRLHSSLNRTERAARLHYFRDLRANGGKMNRPIAADWQSALSTLFFRERLAKDNAEHKRRSKAAKRGWKQRRVNEMDFV